MSFPLPLFPDGDSVVVDDASGRIVYTPGFVGRREAQARFAELRDGVQWRAERRMMYDREVDVPRLTAHFDLADEGSSAPESVRAAAREVIVASGVPFNSVGLNFYRDGFDSVAPHNDHLETLVCGFPIVLLSLGSARRMTIRSKRPPRRVYHLDLEPGSLLSMSYTTQLYYTHGIPKTARAVGPRISLAFRVQPAAQEGRAAYR